MSRFFGKTPNEKSWPEIQRKLTNFVRFLPGFLILSEVSFINTYDHRYWVRYPLGNSSTRSFKHPRDVSLIYTLISWTHLSPNIYLCSARFESVIFCRVMTTRGAYAVRTHFQSLTLACIAFMKIDDVDLHWSRRECAKKAEEENLRKSLTLWNKLWRVLFFSFLFLH